MNKKGFSLIELLIVITIVGVLSAIAVPFYANYTTRAKISNAVGVFNSFDTQVKQFYNSHGRFPVLSVDLNVPSQTTPTDVVFPPYVVSIDGDGISTGLPAHACPYGYTYGYIVNYEGGNVLNGEAGYSAIYYNFYVDVKGTFEKYCFYEEYDETNTASLRQIIPGCTMMINTSIPPAIEDLIANGC